MTMSIILPIRHSDLFIFQNLIKIVLYRTNSRVTRIGLGRIGAWRLTVARAAIWVQGAGFVTVTAALVAEIALEPALSCLTIGRPRRRKKER